MNLTYTENASFDRWIQIMRQYLCSRSDSNIITYEYLVWSDRVKTDSTVYQGTPIYFYPPPIFSNLALC